MIFIHFTNPKLSLVRTTPRTRLFGLWRVYCNTKVLNGKLFPLRKRFSITVGVDNNATLLAVGNRLCGGEPLTPFLGCVQTYCYTQGFVRISPLRNEQCTFPEFTLGGKLYLNIKGQQTFINLEDNVKAEPAFVLYP